MNIPHFSGVIISGEFNIHEKFLRHIWSRRYFRDSGLMTSDGRAVEVLSCGTFNDGSGPDFRNARINIGKILYNGDVEVHRNVAEWIRHGHQTDPAYNGVILHVVFEGNPLQFPTIAHSGRRIPVLILSEFLSESMRTLAMKTARDEERRAGSRIPCAGLNAGVPPSLLEPWIRKLAMERLELKIRRFEERLRELAVERQFRVEEICGGYGVSPREDDAQNIPPLYNEPSQRDLADRSLWDQILYEGIMDGLGYSRNRDPFIRLARNVTLKTIIEQGALTDLLRLEALLFGAAGLLPTQKDVDERASRDRLRVLRRHWKDLSKSLRSERVHTAEWRFYPTRPGNFPTVRIAAAVHVIVAILRGDLFRKIIQLVRSFESEAEGIRGLAGLLEVNADEFWATHVRFGVRSARRGALLGRSRIMDILANSVIPIALLYARTFRDPGTRGRVLALHDRFPALESNVILSGMERQLLDERVALTSMALQQGTLQLYHYYCREERCRECDVGKAVFKT